MSQHELFDKDENPFIPSHYLQDTALENYFLKSNRTLEFIDHQYTSTVSGKNIKIEIGGASIQRTTNLSITNIVLDYGASYLQRFNIYKKGATLFWLMRARNTTDTKYIYWRSANNPGSLGITGIKADTVETVGSVYEEI